MNGFINPAIETCRCEAAEPTVPTGTAEVMVEGMKFQVPDAMELPWVCRKCGNSIASPSPR